jgi:hypothetical protein
MDGFQILEHLIKTRQREFPTALLIDAKDYDLDLLMKAYRLGAHAFMMRPLVKREFCGLMSRTDGLTMDCADGNTAEPAQQSDPGTSSIR